MFSIDPETRFEGALLAAGGRVARFHCAETVASTAAEKRALWEATGADAIEMESGFIRAICRRHSVPSATLRVILDRAEEDLPLDFSRLMTEEMRLDTGKLMLAIARSPAKLAGLLRLHKQSRAAAATLGDALASLLL